MDTNVVMGVEQLLRQLPLRSAVPQKYQVVAVICLRRIACLGRLFLGNVPKAI